MTLHPPSVALGIIGVYVFSLLLLGTLLVVDWWYRRKRRERALDQVLADVAVACIEQPTDARVN